MIRKQDILDRVGEWNLRAEVVEKDYVLGWLLAGIAADASLASAWVFKGGTCLKKCFFETYRFSEDLDFTLMPAAPYAAEAIRESLVTVAAWVAEQSGIDIPPERIEVRARKDKTGRPTFEGKLAYKGPLAMPNWPRIIFDITQHEPVLAAVDRRPIFHPYPDALGDAKVGCYSLAELEAEKTRALLERTRPRDLYDVTHLSDRARGSPRDEPRRLFREKCRTKGLTAPTAAQLAKHVRDTEELRSEWANMLGHQLPALPSLDQTLGRVDEVLAWLDDRAAPPKTLATASGTGELIAYRGAHYWGTSNKLELIRFAGANRLMIEFRYKLKTRVVEPYSFRRKGTGNLLLYGWERGGSTIKGFITLDMYDVRVTEIPFTPRYRVEFLG